MDKILLFIPMYNCEKQITRVLNQIDSKNAKYFSEILIVNNRSLDDSEKVAIGYFENKNIEMPVTIVRNSENYGLGGSHKVAFDYAINNNFDYVVVLHGDDQGNLKDIISILNNPEYKKYDCILGSRFMKASKLNGYSKFRTFGNKIFNIIFSITLNKKITDLGSGLNLYSVKMLKNKFYFKYPDKLTFNCYMLLSSNCYKHKIIFFPITWREDDQVSNVKMVSQAFSTLALIIKYFFRRKKYLEEDFREKKYKEYTFEVVYESSGKNEKK